MTGTTIGDLLPPEFGSSVPEAATLLLYANRRDAQKNYDVDKNFFDKNPKLGTPIQQPQIGLPVLPSDFEYIDSFNDRTWTINDKGKAVLSGNNGGSYFIKHGDGGDILFYVTAGTDLEQYGLIGNVAKSQDGRSNVELAAGNINSMLVSSVKEFQKNILNSEDPRLANITEVRILATSGACPTTPLLKSFAEANGWAGHVKTFDLNPLAMNPLVADAISQQLAKPTTEFGHKLFEALHNYALNPIATDNHKSVILDANSFVLSSNIEPIHAVNPAYKDAQTFYYSPTVSFFDYMQQRAPSTPSQYATDVKNWLLHAHSPQSLALNLGNGAGFDTSYTDASPHPDLIGSNIKVSSTPDSTLTVKLAGALTPGARWAVNTAGFLNDRRKDVTQLLKDTGLTGGLLKSTTKTIMDSLKDIFGAPLPVKDDADANSAIKGMIDLGVPDATLVAENGTKYVYSQENHLVSIVTPKDALSPVLDPQTIARNFLQSTTIDFEESNVMLAVNGAMFINQNMVAATQVGTNLLANNTTPNQVVTYFSINPISSEVTFLAQVAAGNASKTAGALTGLTETQINQGNNISYNSTSNLSTITGPLNVNLNSLLGSQTGVNLLTNSVKNAGQKPTSGLLANLTGTAELDLNTGLLNLNQFAFIPKVSATNPIGAFYEAGGLTYDESASIVDKTARLFNGTSAVQNDQLATFDTNSDGTINSSDSSFSNLNSWQDKNEDGIVDDFEFTNLAEAGISSISVNDSAIAFTGGNANTVAAQNTIGLADSLQVVEPTIAYDYYRNTFNPTRAADGYTWLSSDIKVTDDGQFAVGTSNNDAFFTTNIPTILGGAGNDNLRSAWHENKIWGGAGNDTLIGALGDDTLIGEDGNDAIVGFYSELESEQQVGDGQSDNDSLFGGAGNDTVWGGVGNDTIVGGADNDILVGFYGVASDGTPDTKHTLVGGETDDDVIFGGDGNDTVVGEVGNDTLFGDAGNDVIGGFTFGNDPKQTLAPGESDNDILSGGEGNDTIFGGAGDDDVYGDSGNDLLIGHSGSVFSNDPLPAGESDGDTLWGGDGNDQLQGQHGNDFLLGESGNDLLAGQVGNDTLYGGTGDDVLLGFTGFNETKQTLINNETVQETDDDFLYGGEGKDTLLAGLGDDYLDGGAGADSMEGGEGDDSYVVNTINDVVLERQNAGTDTVLSSVNYLLNSEVENLVLLGTGDISGSGNKLNNAVYGTIGSNVLDGITGADTMVGYAGNDTYYVDNANDVVVEQADEGNDTVNSSISWTLGNNQENLTLLSYQIPERGIIDGVDVFVYGYPKRYELDYAQGDKDLEFRGTCALTAIANMITQDPDGNQVTEEDVVEYATDNDLTTENSTVFANGGTTMSQQQTILSAFGYANTSSTGVNFVDLAAKLKNGQGVLLAVNAGMLWDDESYIGNGDVNHAITVTGVVYDSENTKILGFYIADSGRGLVTDMTRYMSYADLYAAANVANAYMIYTDDAIKLWDVDIDGTGNSLDNLIVGTDGNNVLSGGAGADSLVGGAGNDSYVVDNVDDQIFENTNEGTDSVQSSVSFTIVDNIESLTLTGSADINATGNSGDNTLTGNSGSNILDGGAGDDTMTGGTGNDTYVVDSANDVIVENAAEGTDTVQTSSNYTLSSNLENLTLTGTSSISGTGNNANNILTSNSAGANTLSGGLGDDTYIVQSSSDVIAENTSEGTDTVQTSVSYTLGANVENLILTGTNAIAGGGNSLDNTITGNDAASTLSGATGNDTYIIQNASTEIVENSGEGSDTVMSSVSYTLSSNVENLTLTGSAHLSATGNSENNVLTGNSGNNTLDGGTGVDILIGGAGDDTYVVDNTSDVITENLAEGTDLVQASASYTLGSNVENLTLTGSSSLAGTGNSLDNTITGNSGTSTLSGGAGNDLYIVSSSSTVITENGGEGTDNVSSSVTYTLGANVENLTLTGITSISGTGNSQDNYLTGNTGDNTISGADGNDTIDGAAGVDSMVGGLGDDVYLIDSASDIIFEGSSAGTDTVISGVSYTLGAEVENLTLTGSSELTGTGNTLNNFLSGNTGANTLSGASGNDTLDGGEGADSMVGGSGDDTFYVDNAGDAVSENAAEGTDTVVSGSTYTLGSNLENLTLAGSSNFNATGNSAANVITGNAGNNNIDGSTGNDTMAGGAGNDTYFVDSTSDVATENASEGIDTVNSSVTWTLGANFENLTITGASVANATGNTLDNYLTGSTAANSITGGAGNDTLDGSSGSDTMVGGTGDDVYYVDVATDVLTENVSEGTDTINSSVAWTLASNFENLTLTGSTNFNGTGNTSNNILTGNSGKNSLLGGAGNDTLVGNAGIDTLKGEAGDDVYYVDSSDAYSETSGNGTDTVVANFSETLANNCENLTLLEGAGNLTAEGNNLNNILTGNSGNNTLDGGNGTDTLIGGAGDDRYIIDTATDTLTENSNEGTDTVESEVSWTLGANFENLSLTNSSTSGTGNSLDNYLLAANGSNTLVGGAGNDTLDGGAGTDTMSGGTGDDVYFVSASTDIITELLNEGTDTVNSIVDYTLGSNVENLVLTGTNDRNATGNTLNNSITGNSGDNIISGGAGADTMSGAGGDDTYVVDDAGDVVAEGASAGTDTVQSSLNYSLTDNVENLTLTGASSITGTGNAQSNSITGNTGNNTLDGGAGTDTMVGGTGNDVYIVDSTSDVVTEAASSGTDSVLSSASFTLGSNVENLTLTGTNNINATGNTLNNVLTGNSGNNLLDGGSGIDTLLGGTGDDTYLVDSATDTITEIAEEGTDTVQSSVTYTLEANLENLVLTSNNVGGTGNALDNYIIGASGSNSITGGAGNDTLDGAAGIDTMVGGTGDDVYYVSVATDVVTESANEGIDLVNSAVTYTLVANVENLTLTGASAINGTGNALDNIITGNSVANALSGAAGNDSLIGGGGNDTLDGGTGSDTLAGGTGNDSYIVDSSADVVIESTGEGTDSIQSSVSFSLALAENVENLTLTGTDHNNATGNTLNNTITGNSGNNVLIGGAGADSISGANGNNTIDGGTGADTMAGGTGHDVYYVDNAGDVVNEVSGGGSDTVYSTINYTIGTFVESLTLIGEGDVTATGNAFTNLIIGNSGNNTLDGSAGIDTMRGGLGNDTYLLDTVSDNVAEDPGAGIDTIQVGASYTLGSNFERLILTGATGLTGTGNELDNYLQGSTGADTLIGAAGNDTLDGTTGNDSMTGGQGDDVYVVDVAGDSVSESAGQGTDTVISGISYTLGSEVENLVLSGSTGLSGTGNALNNQITGNTGANSLTGGIGHDTLDGGSGNDTLVGGTGNDYYVVDSVTDVITENASEGTDTVSTSVTLTLGANLENLMLTGTSAINGSGNSLDNVITGNGAANSLSGAAGNDSLVGGAADDTLDGGVGNDTMLGADGDDVYVVDSATDIVTENSDEGIDTVNSSISYTLGANLENLTLTGASSLAGTGNSLDNILTANASGANTLVGGLGNDTYLIQSGTDVVTESADEGIDTVQSSISYTLGANVENLTLTGTSAIAGGGNSLDNVIVGNNAASTLSGGTGNDTYIIQNSSTVISENASEGTDTAQANVSYTLGANVEDLTLTGTSNISGTGNSGDNLITGNSGSNTLSGADGNDTLDGGEGIDSLVGGLGDDTYIVDSSSDAVTESPSSGVDSVISSVNWTLGSDVENLVLAETGVLATDGTGNTLNNSITGNSADNSLSGAAGNDTLDGGLGNDTLVGGTGDDTYFVDSLTDIVTENTSEGTDTVASAISWTLAANVENLTITGDGSVNGAGNSLDNVILGNDSSNIIFGDAGNDSLDGGDGFDTLDGGTGNDTMLGGDGNDTYFVDNSADVVTESADEGVDTVNSTITYSLGSDVENLTLLGSATIDGTGNSLDNRIYGNAGNNSLVGAAGNDTLRGETGVDTMVGGTGNDVYYVDSTSDVITEIAGEGTDTVNSTVDWTLGTDLENLVLAGFTGLTGTGNTLANSITGGAGNDTLTGGGDNDTLDGGLGDDSLVGGIGDDSYVVDSEGDVVTENASEGTDSVSSGVSYTLGTNVENLILTGLLDISGTGNALANELTGNNGANYLSGADGNDIISGFEGNDTLHGGAGDDSLSGGLGDDIYFVDSTDDIVSENADEGTDTVMSEVAWTLGSDFENLTLLGNSSINGTGNSLNNLIVGNTAANSLTGAGGNDTLNGGLGADSLVGGAGDDTYFVDDLSDSITEVTSEGIDTVVSSISWTLASDLENLTLSGYGVTNLNGTGNSADNTIIGDRGENSLFGAGGNDSLSGGIGNDTLDGGTGNDTLEGGAGNDTYYVDSTNDVVTEASYLDGVDSVVSSADYALGAFVENLTLTGGAGLGVGNSEDNVITGNTGNNTLIGGYGNDTLDGANGGSDVLAGGLGDDTYVFYGIDLTIVEDVGQGIDTVNCYGNLNSLSDGDVENITLLGTASYATANSSDNYMLGNLYSNTLNGGAGNDTLDGGSFVGASDTLIGGLGDDTFILNENANDTITENSNEGTDTVKTIFSYTLGSNLENLVLTGTSAVNGTGNAADNMLTGNSASNSLSGGTGNDTYNFGVGGGTDTVSDSGGSLDRISFDESLDEFDIAFFMNGNDLQMSYLGESDQVTVQNQAGSGNEVERFQLSNGKYLTDTEVNTMIQAMATYATANSISFTSLSDVKNSSELMNIVATSWHA